MSHKKQEPQHFATEKGDHAHETPQQSYRFFSNTACKYFPCHTTAHPERFNCLFCFCPLYFLDDCGGRFSRLAGGNKDCTACLVPHTPAGYDHIIAKLKGCFEHPCRLTFEE